MILRMKPFSGYVLLYIYLYKCIFMIMTTSWILFMVILRSTTGPYRRPMIEVAYGKILFRSTKAVWEVIAWEEWLGCRHVVVHVEHTRINTSVGSMYIIFGIFLL